MSTSSHSARRINRADLLRALGKLDKENLDIAAQMSGFAPPVRRKVALKIPSLKLTEDQKNTHQQPKPVTKPQQGKQAQFFRVIERGRSALLPEPASEISRPKPLWYQTAERLNPDAIQPSSIEPPAKEPLVTWSRLWPLLRSLLSEVKVTRQPDMSRIVKTIANGALLERIPRKMRQRWAATVQILVDRPERTCLFNHDYNLLLQQLERLRGETGLVIQKIVRQPGGRVQIVQGKKISIKGWHAPVAGTPVFILSDLGLLDRSGTALRAWLHVGKQLRLAGCRPVVLLPLPERYLTPELVALFDCVSWDRSSKLQCVTYVFPPEEEMESQLQKDSGAAEQLLAWLSPAVRVEPALLRAVRHQLPKQDVDVGHEVAAWHHEDVVPTRLGFYFQTEALKTYRERFKDQADENPELAKVISRLIRDYHCHVFPTQRDEELLILAQLMRDKLDMSDRLEIESAKQAMCSLVKASIEQDQEIPALQSFLAKLLERQHDAVLAENECYQAIWAIQQSKQGISGEIAISAGWDLQTVLSFIESEAAELQKYVLFQQGGRELRLSERKRFQKEIDGFRVGSILAEFETPSAYLLRQQTDIFGRYRNTLLPLDGVDKYDLRPDEHGKQQLHIAGEELTLASFTKPDWAASIGYSADGFFVVSKNNHLNSHQWYWYPQEQDSESNRLPGFWFHLPNNFPSLKPDWAINAGRDQYGLYADAEIAGVIQRFRWIEPTSFMMGSPKDEAGRDNDEVQHQVNLTQGYWLADTVCTQKLWQAVMNNNPSKFKGESRPVEIVSWNDVQKFLQQVNRHNLELKWQLPTEAEWENACRAGAEGAFNFGDEITLDKVNYRGTWDDFDNWGEGALQQTAKVKSYPPNAWGLYEMHGNVWEWCDDWFGDYPSGLVTDPKGPENGSDRVLRGGSWLSSGGRCRSAYRHHRGPSDRFDYGGFRLARGHELKPVRTVRAGQQPADRSATERAKTQAGDGLRSGGK